MRAHAISIRVGATAVAAALVVGFTPAVEPSGDDIGPPHPTKAYQPTLTAQTTALLDPGQISSALTFWVERILIQPSVGAPLPEPVFPPVVAPTSIGSSIKGIYNTVEPWVEYGFDLAAYAVGWIPWVGWLAPQISIFYDFGERIVRSITFNIADWIDRQISFGQGLVNVGQDTVDAFIQLGIDQWNFWLPPLPPLPGAVEATGDAQATEVTALNAAPSDTPSETRMRPVRETPEVTADPLAHARPQADPDPAADPAATDESKPVDETDKAPVERSSLEQKRLDRKLAREQKRAAESSAAESADATGPADKQTKPGVSAGDDGSAKSAADHAPKQKKVRAGGHDRESATADS